MNELAEPFAMTLPAISKHIKVLERAGLVVRGRRAVPPCDLDAAPLEEISTWAEHYRRIWNARFDRMNDYLTQLQPLTKDRQTHERQQRLPERGCDRTQLRRTGESDLEDVDRPRTLQGVVRAHRRHIPVAKMDVRVGGTRLVCMEVQTPDGPLQMWFTGEYREVIENKRLVYTESMADENGNIPSPADMGTPETHPTRPRSVSNSTKSVAVPRW